MNTPSTVEFQIDVDTNESMLNLYNRFDVCLDDLPQPVIEKTASPFAVVENDPQSRQVTLNWQRADLEFFVLDGKVGMYDMTNDTYCETSDLTLTADAVLAALTEIEKNQDRSDD